MGVFAYDRPISTFNGAPFGKEVSHMKSFENYEIAVFGVPTDKQVLENIRRDEPCGADPTSDRCTCAGAKDDYLIEDKSIMAICRDCPHFEEKRRALMAKWEEWVLAMQDVYT
jgi:hypothetical protein